MCQHGLKRDIVGVEEIKPYSEEGDKSGQVASMFNTIAPAYDFMNQAMTFGLCSRWRDWALRQMRITPGARILDVATGTGDVAFRILKKYAPEEVTGIDLSEGMLAEAEKKKAQLPAEVRDKVHFEKGDCLSLPYADSSFDYVTIAYGVRNFADLASGYKELYRVLRKGGTLCVVELSQPTGLLTKWGYNFYSGSLIPLVGRMVSGDKRAYSYLPESIAACPQRGKMALMMKEAGFSGCTWKSLTFGVVTVYFARK